MNLAVIVYFFGRKKERFGSGVFKYLVVPGLGFLACIVVWLSLSGMAKTIGFIWLGVGFVYMLIWTKGFKRKMKPIENIAEDNNDVNSSEISETKVPLQ